MDVEKLKRRKQQLGYTNETLSALTGVPLGTIQKVFGNTTKTPRRKTYVRLARHLAPELLEDPARDDSPDRIVDREHAGGEVHYGLPAGGISMGREEELAYGVRYDKQGEAAVSGRQEKRQGEYTLDDYYAWPGEQRIELIDGVIYDMASPSLYHQLIAGEVHAQLLRCAEEHGVPCVPAIAPLDVQLDKDDRTVVQPDVLVTFDPELLVSRTVYGAPEFVMEVLSDSSMSRDMTLKLYKYQNAGCREYWIVDPEKQRVIVYVFDKEIWPVIYTFDDHVPVHVLRGLCAIDFPKIREKLERWDLEENPERLAKRKAEYQAWMRENEPGALEPEKGE